MAMAARAPKNPPQRRYVTKHALDRIRERAALAVHLDDEGLSGLVNEAIDQALEGGATVANITDRDNERATLVDISRGLDPTLAKGSVFVLLKDNLPDRPSSEMKTAVITVLNAAQAERTMAVERNRQNSPFAKLADLKLPEKPVVDEKLVGELRDEKPPTAPSTEAAYYVHTPNCGGNMLGPKSLEEALVSVEQALENYPPGSVRLFKEVKLKVKISIE